MLTTFAKFLTIVATESSSAEVNSDPVALGENDRVTIQPIVHYFNGPNNPTFVWTVQSSQNGQDWIDVTSFTSSYDQTATTLHTAALVPKTSAVYAAYIRVNMSYDVSGVGSDAGAICFDLFGYVERGESA